MGGKTLFYLAILDTCACMYRKQYCLFGFDLSGSGECFLTNFVPLARAGMLLDSIISEKSNTIFLL